MFFNVLAIFAELERDLIRMRTREGVALARERGMPRGKKPKPSGPQSRELRRMHDTRELQHQRLVNVAFLSLATIRISVFGADPDRCSLVVALAATRSGD